MDTLSDQINNNYIKSAQKLLVNSPDYIHGFYNSLSDLSLITRTSYLRDIIHFMNHEINTVSELKNTELKDFPVDIFERLTSEDIEEYKTWLVKTKKLSNSSARVKLAAVSSFLNYLKVSQKVIINDNISDTMLDSLPVSHTDSPALRQDQIEKLIAGIRKDNLYLVETVDGFMIKDIDEKVFLKRERLVIRNIAIIRLLTSGIRISDLIALDIDDVDLINSSVKAGAAEVSLTSETADALKEYLNGPSFSLVPFSGISKYDDFAKCHISDSSEKLNEVIIKTFPELHGNTSDVRKLVAGYRRHGRSGFKPAYTTRALFITSRGTRMTIRMTEVMVKEMIMTYLPECKKADMFSPNRIRNIK